MPELTDTQRERVYSQAADCYRAQDRQGWRFAALAACSGGTYKDLADYIGGVSPDKVESHAHAWEMYRDLWREYGGMITHVRRMPYVYISHFVVLHRIRRKYAVSLAVCYSYLIDVLQAEGDISSRDLMLQADHEHGLARALPYEANRARGALKTLLTRGDLTIDDRRLFVQTLERLEELSG